MKAIQLQLTLDEINVILEALGDAPYGRVHELVGKIQQQASGQLRKTGKPPGESEPGE